jgi:hypothetical protein
MLEKLTHNKDIEDVIVVAVHAGDRMQEYGVAKSRTLRNGVRAQKTIVGLS